MSKLGKFKEILGVGSAVAKPFVPGGVGSILDKVNQGLSAVDKPQTPGTDAAKDLAKHVDEYNDLQDQAILALHERLNQQDARLKELENGS